VRIRPYGLIGMQENGIQGIYNDSVSIFRSNQNITNMAQGKKKDEKDGSDNSHLSEVKVPCGGKDTLINTKKTKSLYSNSSDPLIAV
jgi:hypothetical protein